MDEELEIFLEDCDDQLQSMENALVDMQENGANDDSIGAIFRAMHTIKGSSGMFGFDNIVHFAHIGENLFELVRQGNIVIDDSMIELFLKCKDHIEKLIELETNDEEISEEVKSTGDTLVKELESVIDSLTEIQDKEKKELEQKDDLEQNISNIVDINAKKWHISIRLKEDFFTTGMSINSIFSFLNKIGKIIINKPIIYTIPKLQDINPLIPYIGFELLVQADTTQDEIEDVFEFVKDDMSLVIFDAEDEDLAKQLILSRNEDKLQNTLVDAGFYENYIFEVIEDKDILVQEQKVESKQTDKKNTATKKSSSLRVDSAKIDLLINYMSEIVIENSKILNLIETLDNTDLEESAHKMKELLELVRNGIMDIRMVQVGESFNKFRRIVSDTSKKIGKDVDFVISGGETELDKTVVERISDPLLHMLRNSIDHGIETPDERVAKGKCAKGRVDLRAYPDAGTIVIEIQDDGKGLDKDRILAKAIESGQVSADRNLSDGEIYKLIFAAGLSTAEEVSDISGRGVGMDVVKRNIEELRGTIDIDSAKDKGSKITIRLPLTLAIIDGFLVQVGETKYIIPLESIQECTELTKKEQESMNGNEFINLRGEMLPIMDVRAILNEKNSSTKRQNIVIVYFGEKMIGLLVDELLGEYQTVIKPLGEVFENVPGISGGSILGSGEVALIFDIARLIEYKTKSVGSVL